MKNSILSIILALFLVGSFGCSMVNKNMNYVVNVVHLNSSYNMMVDNYDALREMAVDRWANFTPNEQEDLKIIDNNVLMIMAKVDTLRSKEFYNLTVTDLGFLYTLARDTYETARVIAVDHADELSLHEQTQLTMFDDQLVVLDEQVKELIDNPDNSGLNDFLSTLLNVSGGALKIIIPLVLK